MLDVLLVSLGSTGGLRAADDELCASLRRAGASAAIARPSRSVEVRTLMLTDLAAALSTRAAARRRLQQPGARAVIYSTTTAALLWPTPGAIRFDAPAAGNRPGRHGLWQRPLEARRLRCSALLLPWSEGGLAEAASGAAGQRAIVLPVPVEPSSADPVSFAGDRARDIAAIAYGANPLKKGLDRVLAAWRVVRGPSEELCVTGVTSAELRRAGIVLPPEGVRVTGPLTPAEHRALLRRARVFVCAPRREDYGIVQLEALAEGCRLVTSAAPGPYAALPLARALDGRLVGDNLGAALRLALDDPQPEYSERARAALVPFSRSETDRTVAEEVLPLLLAEGRR
jgi:glycosyltransferase involved in cell wall biosynthesis